MGAIVTVGLCASILSLVGVLFCTISYEWKRSSPEASQQSLQNIYHSEGLWMRCSIPIAGILQCDNYSTTLFDVEGYLQALRAIVIISSMLMLCSCICHILALDCVTSVSQRKKSLLARCGGGTSFVGGGLCLAAVSWYAAEVIREFNLEIFRDGIKYTFGAALYVGWIAGGLAIIAGALLLIFGAGSDDEYVEDYTYRPPKSRNTEEYV